MSIHANVGASETWVPLTDGIVKRLHVEYCDWIDNLSEIRRRMADLRKAVAAGWEPDEISQRNLDKLNACDEHAAMKQMDVARTILACAEISARWFMPVERRSDIQREWEKLLDDAREKSKPTPTQLSDFTKRLDALRSLWRYGWRPFGNDRNVSWAATIQDRWCSDDSLPFEFRRWSAAQIEIWLSHYENQRTVAKSDVTPLKLGPQLFGRNKRNFH